ncbi:hypothetical protein FC07_GL002213 [Loigolactobacillus bifermentans DSM 20003]|uniref:Uncharacterized protein n=1 Tax=Loigolactobacillus bifermentans DSM 20003 TaxID=1423726 RepID=A0A0R1H8L2_9LACO|nr:hypothetical protein FC07_GL002213 [Loigolactobacillus bifermentans DSM 20003]
MFILLSQNLIFGCCPVLWGQFTPQDAWRLLSFNVYFAVAKSNSRMLSSLVGSVHPAGHMAPAKYACVSLLSQRSYFRWLSSLADENHHARNMAPPQFFNVYFTIVKI